MQLKIMVGDIEMAVEGEAFELAMFARSVDKAAVTQAATAVSAVTALTDGRPPKVPPRAAKKPRAKSTPTCKTCGGRGHRSNHCPSKG